jgi:hypothetical protein
MMVFQISNTSLSDAETANNLLSSWCAPAVEPWPHGAVLGPNCDGNEQVMGLAQLGALIGLEPSCDDGVAFRGKAP